MPPLNPSNRASIIESKPLVNLVARFSLGGLPLQGP